VLLAIDIPAGAIFLMLQASSFPSGYHAISLYTSFMGADSGLLRS